MLSFGRSWDFLGLTSKPRLGTALDHPTFPAFLHPHPSVSRAIHSLILTKLLWDSQGQAVNSDARAQINSMIAVFLVSRSCASAMRAVHGWWLPLVTALLSHRNSMPPYDHHAHSAA